MGGRETFHSVPFCTFYCCSMCMYYLQKKMTIERLPPFKRRRGKADIQTITAQYAYCYHGVSAGWRGSTGKTASAWGCLGVPGTLEIGWVAEPLSTQVPRAQRERVSGGAVGASRGQNESDLCAKLRSSDFYPDRKRQL